MKFLLAGVIDTISDFIGEFINNYSITLDTIFYIGIGFQVLMVIFYLIKSHYAYEGRLERTLDKLSRWLYYHKTIDSSNLIEFNSMMKKTPKLLRHHWQQYMLYRENPPSHYMSTYNCIEKPLHTSSYSANLKNLTNINIVITLLTFVFGFVVVGGTLDAGTLLKSAIVPLVVCILNTLFLMLLRSMQNFNLSSLYFNFSMFQRYIDKASVTLPEYVDFEVLFTKKEISRGIPVLNEYLEKRARQEQEELERARQNAVEHEKYDFSESGIDGSLVLDRAIKETEVYLNARQRILYEIQQLESEMDSFKRNYENTSKEYQRKMQASKENVERLRKQQEETTNRIESNYIKKQQGDEIKKQETLEKDQEDATVRFNQQITSLQSEIDKRRIDLDERKLYVQTAMLAEYQTFSNKLYDKISQSVQERHDSEKQEIINEKDQISSVLQEKNTIIESQNREIEDLKSVIVNAGVNVGDHGLYYNEELLKEEQRVRLGIENKPEEQPVYEETATQPVNEEPVVQELAEEPVTEIAEEIANEEVNNEPVVEAEQEVPQEEQVSEENTEAEYEGYYDENGYYWYPNGTYYDNEGYYHDGTGNVYDSEGNFIRTEELTNKNEEPSTMLEPVNEQSTQVIEEQKEEPQAEETVSEQKEELLVTESEQDTIKEDESKNKTADILDELLSEWMQDNEPVKEESEIAQVSENVEQTKEVEPTEDLAEEKQDGKQGAEEVRSEEVTQEPKKSRGRPRKVVQEPAEDQPKKKRGRPAGSTKNQIKVGTSTGKRGRPRKNPEEEPKVSTGKRGRPRKEVAEDETPKPVAKRGRPKKVETEESAPKTQAKRGRPKGSTTTKKVSVGSATGKRGRPKGSTTTSKPKTSSGKRGRPKGSTKAVAEELKLLNEQIQEEQRKLLEEQKLLNKQLSETITKIDANKETENVASENQVKDVNAQDKPEGEKDKE